MAPSVPEKVIVPSEAKNTQPVGKYRSKMYDFVRYAYKKKSWAEIMQSEHGSIVKKLHSFKPTDTVSIDKLMVVMMGESFVAFTKSHPVYQEVLKLAEALVTKKTKNKWRAALPPKMEICKLEEAIIKKDQLRNYCYVLLKRTGFTELIGSNNLKSIADWVSNLYQSTPKSFRMLQFRTLDSQIGRMFRMKSMKKALQDSSKLAVIQLASVDNLGAFAISYCLFGLAAHSAMLQSSTDHFPMIFLHRYPGEKLKKEAVEDFFDRYCVAPVKETPKNIKSLPQLKIFYSKGALRPIYSIKKTNNYDEKNAMDLFNAILDHLLQQSEGFEKGRSIVAGLRMFCDYLRYMQADGVSKKKIKMLTCDITKCFSTIDHGIMIKVLLDMFQSNCYVCYGWIKKSLPNRTVLFRRTKVAETVLKARQLIKDSVLPCETVTSLCSSSTIRFDWFKKKITEVMSSFKIRMGPKVYSIKKGVPQGFQASSRLAHTYISAFQKDYWAEEKKNKDIFVFRYMDDFLLCSPNEKDLLKMAEPLFAGANRMNLKAKPEKTKMSFEGAEQGTTCKFFLPWCGARITTTKKKILQKRLLPEQGVRVWKRQKL